MIKSLFTGQSFIIFCFVAISWKPCIYVNSVLSLCDICNKSQCLQLTKWTYSVRQKKHRIYIYKATLLVNYANSPVSTSFRISGVFFYCRWTDFTNFQAELWLQENMTLPLKYWVSNWGLLIITCPRSNPQLPDQMEPM